MPAFRTDPSGFPVLVDDGEQQQEQYDAKAPAITPARGVAGFGAAASNGTPEGPAQAG